MNLIAKATLFVSLITGIGVFSAAVASNNAMTVNAEYCSHEGNHYDALLSTSTTSGTKEYWICCKCHEHFLEKPTGTWNDAGVAMSIEDSNDNRYIPMVGEKTSQGLTLSADGKTILDFDGSVKNVVIPEGITSIADGVFANKDLDSVIIPSSITSIPAKAFYDSTIARNNGTPSNNIVIYISMTKAEVDEKVASGEFSKDWAVSYTSTPLGWGLIGRQDHEAEIVYANEWHLDENGVPVKNS